LSGKIKMTQALEQMLENTFVPDFAQDKMYQTIDTYTTGTTVLYTPPVKIFDLPNIGATIHIHGSADGNTLYGGDVRPIGMNKPFQPLNSYESAMADYYLTQAGIKPIEPKK